MHEKNILVAVLLVLIIMLVINSDLCRNMIKGKPDDCGCGSDQLKIRKKTVKELQNQPNRQILEAFSTRPYRYNQDTVGKGVSWQSDQLDKDHVMAHDDYIRSVGVDKATVENHREWYEDPNIKPYYGSNFNLRSDYEQAALVPTVGLRRRPTRVPIGVSSRQVPDIDERDYTDGNQLTIGNFVGGFDNTQGY